jgi:hypothetical protein
MLLRPLANSLTGLLRPNLSRAELAAEVELALLGGVFRGVS